MTQSLARRPCEMPDATPPWSYAGLIAGADTRGRMLAHPTAQGGILHAWPATASFSIRSRNRYRTVEGGA